jgi:hypothetical protein
MSHATQQITVIVSWGAPTQPGGPPASEERRMTFVGEPRMPLTPEERAAAQWDAIMQAIRWLASLTPSTPAPRHEP